jgi:hypothetical protein
MIRFTALISRFDEQGEKTGWTYIEVPEELAQKLLPGNKKSFRVKGMLDAYQFEKAALIPMGDGNFILPFNAAIRKGTGKRKGATVKVQMELDARAIEFPPALMECLEDEPTAKAFFLEKLPRSEQNYFSKWIESAKTEPTKAKRIAQAVNGFTHGYKFNQMIRALKGM